MSLHEISDALVREIRHRAEARHVSAEVLLRYLHIYNLTHTSTPAVAAATPEQTP